MIHPPALQPEQYTWMPNFKTAVDREKIKEVQQFDKRTANTLTGILTGLSAIGNFAAKPCRNYS